VAFALRIIKPGGAGITESLTGSVPGSVGAVSAVKFSRANVLMDTAVGHLSVTYGAVPLMVPAAYALGGYAGELALDRFTRICAEMGIAAETIGTAATSAAMGPQVDDTLTNVLQSIEDTDMGLLFESRTQFGLGYRTLASMANQAAAATISYNAGVLDPSLAPVYDDSLTRNNVTVTNQSTGYTQQAILTAGPMSILNPPNGIGNGYAYPRTVNAAADSQIPGIANWLLNVGSVDEVRFPVITLKMVRASAAPLFAAIPGLRPGDYLQITNPPSFLTASTVRQLAVGYTETIGGSPKEWTFAFNTVPESPYETGFSAGTVQTAQLPGSGAVTSTAPGAGGLGGLLQNGSITPAMLNAGITVKTLGGNRITISASAPANPDADDIWIASATGLISQWNGSAWAPFKFDGSATIVANTIGAAQLAAGIVYAGIVDATTITGATFIATGSSGEVLVYSGTPASGNLVFSISPAAGTDANGNAYLSGAVSYDNPGGSQWIAASVDGGTANVYTATSSAGPWTQIGSVGSLANDGNIHFSAHGGAFLVADTSWYKQDPSGSGREAWHDMRPLSNSFTGTVSGEYPPQYRLTIDGCVEIFGSVQLPGAGSYNGITFFTLPAGYRPVSHAVSFPVGQTGGTMSGDSNAGIPRVFIDTTGAIQYQGISPGINSSVVRMMGKFPLDVTGLITS